MPDEIIHPDISDAAHRRNFGLSAARALMLLQWARPRPLRLPSISSPGRSHAAPEPKRPAVAKDKEQEEASQSPFSVTVGQVYDGPLDLLLDLIRKQNIDIYDIPIARITSQFLEYTHHLQQTDVDAAGEFIYMASLLIHIKSKTLLPRDPSDVARRRLRRPAPRARRAPPRARALQGRRADAPAEAADRRGHLDQSRHEATSAATHKRPEQTTRATIRRSPPTPSTSSASFRTFSNRCANAPSSMSMRIPSRSPR